MNHIGSAISAGEKLDITALVTAAEQEEIRGAFERHPGGLLSPVKEALGSKYSYDQLRLVAATLGL